MVNNKPGLLHRRTEHRVNNHYGRFNREMNVRTATQRHERKLIIIIIVIVSIIIIIIIINDKKMSKMARFIILSKSDLQDTIFKQSLNT